MRVRLTDAALDDLTSIGRYIMEAGSDRGEAFVREIEQRCLELGFMPEAYPLLPGREGSGIRRCTFREYLIIYRVHSGFVEIIRVLHGARDIDGLLFPDD
ncbi:MAG: type II toxin-antitoxin system RelE/ParE family toxin [Bauldia sp.]